MKIYLLDDNMKQVPVGSEGEIFIGGIGVGKGYHNRPELNRERFLPDKFSKTKRKMLYKTGDKSRRRKDGAYIFLGRYDNQIKIRGQRVEPEEIESALRQFEGIKDCIVASPDPVKGNRKLVAYYVSDPGSDFTSIDLYNKLSEKLPLYMVPSLYIKIEAFPLTPNKKIDRNRLPPPEEVNKESGDQPTSKTERLLAGLWSQVLGMHEIDIDTDFFILGGDSLSALELSVYIEKKIGIFIPLSLLFKYRTIRTQAKRIDMGDVHDNIPCCVPLSTHGKGNTLVIIGDGGWMKELIENLEGVRIVGFVLPMHPANLFEDNTIQNIAQIHAETLFASTWKGPYVITGYSINGLIALELSRILLKAGKSVESVVLLDTPTPQVPLGDGFQLLTRFRLTLRVLKNRSWIHKFTYCRGRVRDRIQWAFKWGAQFVGNPINIF